MQSCRLRLDRRVQCRTLATAVQCTALHVQCTALHVQCTALHVQYSESACMLSAHRVCFLEL